MPLKLPRSTFHAGTAGLPTVSASLFITQPPVKTSAVRASTYAPVTEPLPPARSGDAATPTIDRTRMSRFICNLGRIIPPAPPGTEVPSGDGGSLAGTEVPSGDGGSLAGTEVSGGGRRSAVGDGGRWS